MLQFAIVQNSVMEELFGKISVSVVERNSDFITQVDLHNIKVWVAVFP